MAATYRASAVGGDTTSTNDRVCTIVPAVGDLLVVFVALSANTNASSTLTDNNGSGTYTRIMHALWNVSGASMLCFVRDALMVNTTSTVITCTSGSNSAGSIVAVAVSGMTRTGLSAIRSSGSQANQLTTTTPTPVLNQAALTQNMTIWAVGGGDVSTTEPSGWTERRDAAITNPTTVVEIATRDSGFTGTSVAAGAAEDTVYASMVIELNGDPVPLTAASGTFIETGTDASLKYGRKLSAASGTFVETGTDASLKYGRKLSVDSGTFVETGTDATLKYGRKISVDSGTFVETGTDVNLLRTLIASVESGTFIETGSDAALKVGYKLSADSGTFVETGTPADLIHTLGNTDYPFQVDPGTYTVTPGTVNLVHVRRLVTDSGTYTCTGTAATMSVGEVGRIIRGAVPVANMRGATVSPLVTGARTLPRQ